MGDGEDYMSMPTWKVFFIQLLDIAGLGPIFGPILGALYGPSALVWIVIGCIFAGAVHDYFSGILYPVFGALLIFMTFGVMGDLIFHGYEILPNLDLFTNTHPTVKPIWPRLFITLSCGAISGFHSTQSPLMAAFLITQVDFKIIWRYFGWSNQMLSMLVLWASAIYLAKKGKNHWICSIPATFMTAVDAAFILQAQIGFNLPATVSNIASIAIAALVLGLFLAKSAGNSKISVLTTP